MKIRIAWKNKIYFDDLESGSQSFAEGGKLEDVLWHVFTEIRTTIATTASTEDNWPLRVDIGISFEVTDDNGNKVIERTPRKLFDALPESVKADLKKTRKKGGANNGQR